MKANSPGPSKPAPAARGTNPRPASSGKCIFHFQADELLDVCNLARNSAAEGSDAMHPGAAGLARPLVSLWAEEDRLRLKRPSPHCDPAAGGGADVLDIFRRLQSAKRAHGSVTSAATNVTTSSATNTSAPVEVTTSSAGGDGPAPATEGPRQEIGAAHLKASSSSDQLAAMRDAALKALAASKASKKKQAAPPPVAVLVEKEEGELSDGEEREEPAPVALSAAPAPAVVGHKRDLRAADLEREEGELSDVEKKDYQSVSTDGQLEAMREAALKALAASKARKAPAAAPPTENEVMQTEKEEGELSDDGEVHVAPIPATDSLAKMRAAALEAMARRKKSPAPLAATDASQSCQTKPSAAPPAEDREEGEVSSDEAPPPKPAPAAGNLEAMRQAALMALRGKEKKTSATPTGTAESAAVPAARAVVEKEEGEMSDDGECTSEAPESREARLAAMRATALKLVKPKKPTASPVPPALQAISGSGRYETLSNAIIVHLREYLVRKNSTEEQIPPPFPAYIYGPAMGPQSGQTKQPGHYRCSWCGISETSCARGQFFMLKRCFATVKALQAHTRMVHPTGKPSDVADTKYFFYHEYDSVTQYSVEEPHPVFTAIVSSLRSTADPTLTHKSNMELLRTEHRKKIGLPTPERPAASGEASITVNALAAEQFLSSLHMGLMDGLGDEPCETTVPDEPSRSSAGDLVQYASDSDVCMETVVPEGQPTVEEIVVEKQASKRPEGLLSNHTGHAATDQEATETLISAPPAPPVIAAATRRLDREAEVTRLLEREADLKVPGQFPFSYFTGSDM